MYYVYVQYMCVCKLLMNEMVSAHCFGAQKNLVAEAATGDASKDIDLLGQLRHRGGPLIQLPSLSA